MEEEEAMDVVSFWLGVRRRLEVKGRGGEGKGSVWRCLVECVMLCIVASHDWGGKGMRERG
jgi:hypothetical protein